MTMLSNNGNHVIFILIFYVFYDWDFGLTLRASSDRSLTRPLSAKNKTKQKENKTLCCFYSIFLGRKPDRAPLFNLIDLWQDLSSFIWEIFWSVFVAF